MSSDSRNAPLSYGELIPKLTPDDTDGKPVALTVRRARRQNMAQKGKPEEIKIILEFGEEFEARKGFDPDAATRREYVVNSTSYKTLCMKLGNDESRWAGQTVVMAPATTTFEGTTFEKLHVATADRWDKVINATAKAKKAR